VEQAAEAVAAELAHHAVAVLLGMRLDRRADIAEPRAGLGLLLCAITPFAGGAAIRAAREG
jgi:hypothetical protein